MKRRKNYAYGPAAQILSGGGRHFNNSAAADYAARGVVFAHLNKDHTA